MTGSISKTFLLMLLAAPLTLVAQQDFAATIDGVQVVPSTGSLATGSASLTLDATQTSLTYDITLVGLDLDGLQTPADPTDDVANLHFHFAPAGANGPVRFGIIAPGDDADDLVLDPVAGTISGVWEETDPLFFGGTLATYLAELEAGELYINVHTTAFPAGEIRGQILPVVPPVISIPTLGVAGIAVLGLLLVTTGMLVIKRRHRA